ncbi:MAG: DUF3334 family protein [Gammaproteobacteria bacterium]|nr:DUF3334 family protein [Gammaproteobacteria bacterium]
MAKKKEIKNTQDILRVLCKSVNHVLNKTTNSNITYSPTIQKISRTCLKPDLSCFVLFEGSFSGLIIINLTADAAIEIYKKYMANMGMPDNHGVLLHTSDDVGNTLGELMNQIVGDFQGELEYLAKLSIKQTQPKMLALNKEVLLSVSANIDRPQSRRVVFSTEDRNTFYLEMSMEKTDFLRLDSEAFNDGFDDDDSNSKSDNHKKIMDDLNI